MKFENDELSMEESLKVNTKYTRSGTFAFIVSPLIATVFSILLWLIWLIPGADVVLDSIGIMFVSEKYWEALAYCFFYGIAFSIFTYPILLIYAAPIHLLFRKFKLKKWYYYVLAGMLPGIVLMPFLFPITFESERNYAITFILWGGAVAFSIWYISVRSHRE